MAVILSLMDPSQNLIRSSEIPRTILSNMTAIHLSVHLCPQAIWLRSWQMAWCQKSKSEELLSQICHL